MAVITYKLYQKTGIFAYKEAKGKKVKPKIGVKSTK